MGATLNELKAERIFLLRSGKHHNVFGDPYSLTAVVLVNGYLGEIQGASGVLYDIPAIKRLGRDNGLRQIKWDRIVGGETIQHTINLY